MADVHYARVSVDEIDAQLRKHGRFVVRLSNCRCEFYIEPGRVTFHEVDGMNYNMQAMQ